jgi:septal ring factor EnvC (AmiA/AmiB activator)
MEGMQTEIHSLSKKLKAVFDKLNTVSEELKDVPRELNEVKEDIRLIKKGRAKEWLDGQEVALALNISLRTLQHMREQGLIPYSRFHNKLFYKKSDVDAILETNYLKNQPKNKKHD